MKALSCPTEETIAAFIDGRLTVEERHDLLEHFYDCEDCYAVFVETIRFKTQHLIDEAEAEYRSED
jgi:hypothetical protein